MTNYTQEDAKRLFEKIKHSKDYPRYGGDYLKWFSTIEGMLWMMERAEEQVKGFHFLKYKADTESFWECTISVENEDIYKYARGDTPPLALRNALMNFFKIKGGGE